MPGQDRNFRPRVDSFEFLGAHLEIVDAAGLLRGGLPDDAQLLHGKGFPSPIRALWVSIATATRDDVRVHEFRGRIQVAGDVVPGQQSDLVKALGPVGAPAAAAAAVIVGAAVPLAVAAASAYRARQRAAQESASREAPATGQGPVGTAQGPVGTAAQDPVAGTTQGPVGAAQGPVAGTTQGPVGAAHGPGPAGKAQGPVGGAEGR
ncbi:MAG TPA: hypothetical protein VF755_04555, partial [Catenuloplanes sp.]